MKLSDTQIKQILKKPQNQQEVQAGKKYESKLRILTEGKSKKNLESEEGWKDFKKYINQTITTDKAKRIEEFIKYPLSVCAIPDSLVSDLYKVFHAGNSFFSIVSVKKNGGEKINKLFAKINLNRWIESEGKKVFKNKPNTIVVVDKDEEGEPYLVSVSNSRLIDFGFDEEQEVQLSYVTFIHSLENEEGEKEKRVAYYDKYVYSVWIEKDGGFTLDSMTEHNLGYCPARMFVDEPLNSNSQLNRKIRFSLVMAKLEEWQLFDIYKTYTDHYAPFPVTEMVKAKCVVDNCMNGIISKEQKFVESGETRYRTVQVKCQACKGMNEVGVGAKILLDPQGDKDEPTAAGKFRMISNDVENLRYLAEKLEQIEKYITLKVIGQDNILTKEAVNEKQVKGSFESKTNVLLSLKSNLDSLYYWIAQTVVLLGVGEKPVTITVNYGTEWYLQSEEDLVAKFNKAKEAGLPRMEIDEIYNQLIDVKYKGNPNKIQALKLINKLNPIAYKTTEQRMELFEKGIITKESLIIAENLLYFVNKFQSENGEILEFGENLGEGEQRKRIFEIFKQYANEYGANEQNTLE